MNLDTLAATAGAVADPTPAQLAAGRHRLDASVHAASLRVAAVRRGRSPRRWVIQAIAGAAAVGAAVLTLPLLSAGPASAETVLLAAADAAGRQVDAAAGAAYWHVTSEVDYPDTEPFRREIWQGRTGETVLRDEIDAAFETGGGPIDPDRVRTKGLGEPATFVVGGHALTWQDLEELPTDATQLRAVLMDWVRGHPSGEDNELWESVTGLLRESPASPALRRALWQVAASIPDVELVGTVTDAIGREGTAIERNQLDAGWYRVVYVLDPHDGTLLETRDVRADGTVAYRATEISREPSATAPATQPPLCGPGSVPAHSC